MVQNDLVDSFCYSQENVGLKGLTNYFKPCRPTRKYRQDQLLDTPDRAVLTII